MQVFLIGVGILLLVSLLLGAGIYQVWKIIFPDETKDPTYLEHYTTDGRPRHEVFPTPKDKEPAC